jgi:hypothetical protein
MGPIMTNLERLVASRAIGSTFISNLSSEISFERIIIEGTHFNLHSNTWILSIALIYMYGQFKFNEGLLKQSEIEIEIKLQNIQIYDYYEKIIRNILFIFFLIFTRDVQNAI